ncbi:MAG: hypothetical protein U0610_11920 [bacterium]
MPLRYTIDPERRLVVTSYEGTVTDADLLDHQRAILRDPDFCPDYHQLSDARGTTRLLVTGDGIRALAETNVFSALSRRAIVVVGTAQFGLARMFQTLRERGPERIEIFTDYDEAVRWLAAG